MIFLGYYFDNAATSFPKPNSVINAVTAYMKNIGANPGRGGYKTAIEADKIIYSCRESIMNFYNFDKFDNVIFTPNITFSINILLKSIVKDGWHIITTSMDHNSVLRPLSSFKNIEVSILPCDKNGFLNIDTLKNSIRPDTKLLIMSHASNIIGSIQPIYEIGRLCHEKNIYFIIDTAQTSGVIPIDFYKLNLSALAFTGHKGLLGPSGTGGFLISDKLNSVADPVIEGGTGSLSESIVQPNFLPDKFESGTMNAAGIAGLSEGIKHINKIGLKAIKEKEDELTKKFLEGLTSIKDIIIYGSLDVSKRTSTISINSKKVAPFEFAYRLDKEFDIMVRCGLHCAPLAHKTIGSFPDGTVRFSFGIFNTLSEIDYALNAINKIHNS